VPWQDDPVVDSAPLPGYRNVGGEGAVTISVPEVSAAGWQNDPVVDASTSVSPIEVASQKKLTPNERFISGPLRQLIGQGAMMGFGDEAMGVLRSGRLWGPEYEKARNAERQAVQAYEAQAPEAGALKLAGAIAPMLIPGVGQIGMGSRVLGGLGPLSRAALEGAAYGGLEGLGTTEDKSKLGDTLGNVAFGAGAGAGMGAAAAKFVAPAIAGVASRVRSMTGTVAQDVLNHLSGEGVAVTPELERYVRRQLANGADIGAVIEAATARAQGIPLTTGQLTGDVAQLSREAALRRGEKGAPAMQRMAEQDRAAQEAMQGRVESLGADIARTGQPPTPTEGGRAVSEELSNLSQSQRTQNRAAYEAAEERGRDAVLATGANIGQDMSDAVLSRFHPEDVPNVFREIQTLGENPSLSQVYAARKRLSEMRVGPPSMLGTAASEAVAALDAHVMDALDNALVAGDTEAVNLWRDAIGQYREWAQVFKRGDLVQKLTERVPGARGEAATVLKVPPQDAANLILGRSTLGFIGKKGLSREAERIRNVLGPDSLSWNALRGEMFMRFGQAATKSADQFRPEVFSTSWQRFLREDPALANTMFSPEEQRAITQFATLARRAGNTGTRAAEAARSNLSAVLNKLNFLKAIPVTREAVEAFENAGGSREAAKAVSGALPVSREALRTPQMLSAVGAASGVAGAEPAYPRTSSTGDVEQQIMNEFGVEAGGGETGGGGSSVFITDPVSGQQIPVEEFLSQQPSAEAAPEEE
jgi:hypothetical protein